MSVIDAHWADANIKLYGKKINQLNEKFPKVLPRIVNQVGNKAKTQVIRNLTKQTGLPRKTIVKAIGNPGTARAGKLSYEMVTRGGKVRLKFLAPKEFRYGVSAKPFGKRQRFAGAFMRGGGFPDRKIVQQFDGHVYRRLNTSGTKITQVRSEVVIPNEMTTGATRSAFRGIAGPELKVRVDMAIKKLLK